MGQRWSFGLLMFVLAAATGDAQIFGTIRGAVVDPDQAVIAGAKINLQAQGSAWSQQAQTDGTGEFILSAVPAGVYTIEIQCDGFQTVSQPVNVTVGSAVALHIAMQMGAVSTTAEVVGQLEVINPDSSSAPVTISEQDILHTPGADRMSSLAFITNFAPGAYMLHDHLHIRGGHQVSWLVDGVPVPNTNMSSNVGRAMDPKDIESVEVNRGGYSARYGDRTYGVVNIITRSGFEFENDGELSASYGSFNQTNDQVSFGGHSRDFAYYASAGGNRTDLGLEPPTQQIIHNQGSGLSGFTSMTYNLTPVDQLRLNTSVRQDHYQIPNFPEDQQIGVRDIDQERDSFVNFSWVRTLSAGALLTVSPFFHYNNSQYNGGPADPLLTTDHRTSNYVGAQAVLTIIHGEHNLNAGLYGFAQHDAGAFALATNAVSMADQRSILGGMGSAFIEEQYKPWSWLTANAGVRLTHFSGPTSENAANPRLGGTIQIPKLKWVLRGFYGYYYQPPPLYTIGGPLLSFAEVNESGAGGSNQVFAYLPLHGERDIQREYGLTVPFRAWIFDFDHFRTDARNFLDHDVLGNSNITLPLSIGYVRVRGWEGTVRSPQLWHRLHLHLAYSNQVVKGRGSITGGLVSFVPPQTEFFYIDHDQRDTVAVGGEVTLPGHAYFSATVNYGSGFLKINGPEHLPPHTTGDFALGKSLGQRWSFGFSALNVSNSRYLLGLDNAFAGTHYSNPREFIGQIRYKFHF